MQRRGSFGKFVILGLLTATGAIFRGGPSRSQDAQIKEQTSVAKDNLSHTQRIKPLLVKYCFACHGNGKKRLNVSFDNLLNDDALYIDRKMWESVIDKLRAGEMPPEDKPQPTADESKLLVKSIEEALASFDCAKFHNAGRVTVRRLNRLEYNNTIRDLLGIDFKPAADFPLDDVGYGFDNIGDVLSVSPVLIERYMEAAEAVLERAIIVIDPPEVAKRKLIVRATADVASDPNGIKFLRGPGKVWGEANFKEGEYVIGAEVSARSVGNEPTRGEIVFGQHGELVKEFELASPVDEWVKIAGRIRVKAGTEKVFVRLRNPSGSAADNPEAGRPLYVRRIDIVGPYNPPIPPLPKHTERLLAHTPGLDPREPAPEVIARCAAKAFRRRVASEEVEPFVRLWDQATQEGLRFELGLRRAFFGILVSPKFLFRIETDPPSAKPGTVYAIDEFNLASRMSYFIWNSMPDEILLSLAAENRLRENLESQVKRMLKDPKALSFVNDFAGQWLLLRALANVAPDPKFYPKFDTALRQAMQRETELFFETMVLEDHSIFDLLDSDFSFVNERLARHYGIEGIEGEEFQRVRLPKNRLGVLTHGSILTLTSNPNRTSPVKRGKFILDQILNAPPPPPPPDVPDLDEQKAQTGSLRQMMEQHRARADCAACHAKLDPLGFAFESYDGVGAWRDKDGGTDIDASGVLPDGRKFSGPVELIAIFKDKKGAFGRGLTEKMLTYALGRGLEYYDRCAVEQILTGMERNDFRFSVLITEIVKSEPFQMRVVSETKKAN